MDLLREILDITMKFHLDSKKLDEELHKAGFIFHEGRLIGFTDEKEFMIELSGEDPMVEQYVLNRRLCGK